MKHPRTDSIEAVGLRAWLDARKDKQNGWGYEDFVRMMSVPRQPTYSSVGRQFNVDGQTIKSWWIRYQLEQKERVYGN